MVICTIVKRAVGMLPGISIFFRQDELTFNLPRRHCSNSLAICIKVINRLTKFSFTKGGTPFPSVTKENARGLGEIFNESHTQTG